MENRIVSFNWRAELENIAEVDSIGNDFILLDNPIITPSLNHPFKVDVTIAIICTKGTMKGTTNLKPHTSKAPCFIIILSDQILQNEYVSEDFEGFFVVMSKRFTEDLFRDAQDRFSLLRSVQDTASFTLNEQEMEAMMSYYTMMKRAIGAKDNPYRMEMARHLTKAFFYGIGFYIHKKAEGKTKTKHELFVETFLGHVKAHYKEQRGVEFYADKMCLTPKYLSKVIKENSGLSANDWVDNYVVLEAKALLKSTGMTIQQISDELNFPSQSFFGKYFKRLVGMPPSEYKGK
ncbi:MAG: helix-turn-helix domain-containing protein [Prevotellaceae bacterium]|jgi:YesN/AraC family two-component response regulator|nr:helix-turn-helix domain-containing protein [Prevotellaceae bacterium]